PAAERLRHRAASPVALGDPDGIDGLRHPWFSTLAARCAPRAYRKGETALIGLEQVYWLAGAMFAGIAVRSVGDRANRRRFGNASFWGLLAVSFIFGSELGDLANGLLVLALTALGAFAMGLGSPKTTSAAEREKSARVKGNVIFAPALVIPAIA